MESSGDDAAADELRFLQEIASYLETQELLPASVLCSVSEHDLNGLLTDSDDSAAPASLLGVPQDQQQHQQSPTRAARRAKRSRNLSRERLQSELKQLRVQSQELEQRVAALRQQQTNNHEQRQQQQRQQDDETTNQEQCLLLLIWEQIAQHQLAKRARAENENARLRGALAREMAFARTLQQAVHQFATINTKTTMNSDGRFHLTYQLPRVCVETEDVALFEILFTEVDAAFHRMDSVFQENGLSLWLATTMASAERTASRNSQVQMKTRSSAPPDEGSPYIEMVDTEMLPADKEIVFKILSRLWEKQYMNRNCVVYETVGQSKDSVASKMHFDVFVDGTRVALELIFVLKLFVERDRIVYVWAGTSKADAHFPGVYIHETGWQVIQTVAGKGDIGGDTINNADRSTTILTCSQLESKKLNSDAATSELDAVAAGTPLANLLVLTYEAEMLEVSAMMTDLLLEETLSSAELSSDA